jgi:DNA-binding NtrC family response regulator
MRDMTASDDSLRAWSSRYARAVLERCRGNKRRTCEILDISYHTLQAHLDYERARPLKTPASPVQEDSVA